MNEAETIGRVVLDDYFEEFLEYHVNNNNLLDILNYIAKIAHDQLENFAKEQFELVSVDDDLQIRELAERLDMHHIDDCPDNTPYKNHDESRI